MSVLAPIVRDLLVKGIVARTAVQTARHGTAGIGFFILAGGIGLVGFIFLCIASYGLLLEYFTMPVAAAITGGAIWAIAACVALAGWMKFRKISLAPKPKMDSGMFDSIEDMLKPVLEPLEEPIRDNPKTAVLLAALAGFAAGDRVH